MIRLKIPPVIPHPVKITLNKGNFFLSKETFIDISPRLQASGNILQKVLVDDIGLECRISKETYSSNCINLRLNDKLSNLGKEGYSLIIDTEKILIQGAHERGLYYAIQTLRQLIPLSPNETAVWPIQGIQIVDYPRFRWRGFMLDEGRHFQGKTIVKRMLDLMALHKLNKFHWHLSEDQGWRIQINKFPKLTEIGSFRKSSQIGGYRSFIRGKKKGPPHQGFYTQEDIHEIVDYASQLFIDVIPEIDLPGHSTAILASYPEYSCTGGPFEVATTWGIKKDVLCVGKESTFQFLEQIFNELLKLFPSRYFHFGGDEVPKDRWKECPDCQKRLIDEHLANEEALQKYFTNRIGSFLLEKGKIPIGWNEIITERFEDLNQEIIGQHWLRKDDLTLAHLQKGRKFIVSKFFHTYLDYPYYMTPLRKVYHFDPIPSNLSKEFHNNVLGIEAPLWTEWVPNLDRFDWQVFPRLTAIAETAWTFPSNKNYQDFRQRLTYFLKRLDKMEVKYAKESIVDPSWLKRIFTPVLMFRDPDKNISK